MCERAEIVLSTGSRRLQGLHVNFVQFTYGLPETIAEKSEASLEEVPSEKFSRRATLTGGSF